MTFKRRETNWSRHLLQVSLKEPQVSLTTFLLVTVLVPVRALAMRVAAESVWDVEANSFQQPFCDNIRISAQGVRMLFEKVSHFNN